MMSELYKGSGELRLAVVFNGFCNDFVQIVVIENYDVICATPGGVQ